MNKKSICNNCKKLIKYTVRFTDDKVGDFEICNYLKIATDDFMIIEKCNKWKKK